MTLESAMQVVKAMALEIRQAESVRSNLPGQPRAASVQDVRRMAALEVVMNAARNRCTLEIRDGERVVRYEAPTVEELDRLRLADEADIIPLTVAG